MADKKDDGFTSDVEVAVTDNQGHVVTVEPSMVRAFGDYKVKGVDRPLRLSPEHAKQIGATPV